MDPATSIRCPNCDAPLQVVPGQEQVSCAYCGQTSWLPAAVAAPEDRAITAEPPAVAPSAARMSVLASVAVGIAVAALGLAFAVHARSPAAPVSTTVPPETSAIDQVRARERAAVAQAEAQRVAAEQRADEARAETERVSAPARPRVHAAPARKPKPKPKPKLPDAPAAATVVAAVVQVDLSDCVGPARVTYDITVLPSGEVAMSLGPVDASGSALDCIEGHVERLRFPATQHGIKVSHDFVLPK